VSSTQAASSLSIIVPCFNEADNVQPLATALAASLAQLAPTYDIELVLVDDGSSDQTWERLLVAFSPFEPASLGVRFCRHPSNQGLGAALRTGVRSSQGEFVVTADSDGTYSFDSIPLLVGILAAGADLVTASPYHPEGGVEGVPAYRLILSKGSSLIYRVLVDRKIFTYTSLFRAYRRPLLDEIDFVADDFLAGTEILIKAWFAGFRIAELPAVLHVRKSGVSKAKIGRTILSHLGFQFQVLSRRLGVQPVGWGAKGEQAV
jgi:dolichol-phosphate mannosyltransferase